MVERENVKACVKVFYVYLGVLFLCGVSGLSRGGVCVREREREKGRKEGRQAGRKEGRGREIYFKKVAYTIAESW